MCQNSDKHIILSFRKGLKVSASSLQLLLHIVRQFGKEIPAQQDGDAGKQIGVDALFLKEAVHVGAVARQLAGKPADATFLPL